MLTKRHFLTLIMSSLFLMFFQPVLIPINADEADVIFDTTTVHEICVIFEDSNWYNTLFNAYMSGNDDYYLPCTWVYQNGDETISLDSVGMRFKGHSSFWDSGVKKSFKVDFNEFISDQRFLGLKKLNLNNNFRDPSMMREILFLGFANEHSLAHRSSFARVIINGELWGFFTLAEQIDSAFRDRIFGDNDDGNLFKGENQADLNYLGNDPELYYDYYELKTNETENDWSDLVSFLDLLNNTPDDTFPDVLPTIIDTNRLIEHFALNILLINLDAYIGPAHNLYMYHQMDTDKFVHLIWDCNMAFGNYTQPFPQGYDMIQVPLTWYNANENGRPLAERLWQNEAMVRDHYRKIALFLRDGFNSETFDQKIDELADLIRADVYADPNKEYTNEEFDTSLETDVGTAIGLKRFVADRYDFVKAELDSLALTTDLRCNELMTINQSTLSDEQGDYDPWIEIYNLGPGRVSINNLYLSDELSQPGKWQLPSENLQDGQFMLLWLDAEEDEGANHASFTTQSEGGNLYLHAFVDDQFVLVDTVTYPALTADASWGRWPDGTGDWSIAAAPSPGNENYQPFVPDIDVTINEFMAGNETSYQDEAGEHEDWLEMYNSGTEVIDLTGLYLTDSTENLTKWKIPELTIQPGGYIVFICDEDQEQGNLHTNFKLSRSGETISLVYSDGITVLDTIEFQEQVQDVSFGRYPDGGNNWQFIPRGTPGGANPATATTHGMLLNMLDSDLEFEDRLYLYFTLGPQSSSLTLDAYILLGVGDSFWSWPNWTSIDQELIPSSYTLPSNTVLNETVFDLSWPQVSGSANGLFFYGAAFNQGAFDIIGDVQAIEFGYH